MSSSEPLDLRLPTPGCYADPERAGLDADAVFDGMTEHLFFTLGKLAPSASRHDLYMALSYAVRDRLMTRYLASLEAIRARRLGAKLRRMIRGVRPKVDRQDLNAMEIDKRIKVGSWVKHMGTGEEWRVDDMEDTQFLSLCVWLEDG